MATELRTLKDMPICNDCIERCGCWKYDLQEEAIKHILNLLNNADVSVDTFLHDNNDYPIRGPADVDRVSYIAMAVAFKSFFNITDQELNDALRGKNES